VAWPDDPAPLVPELGTWVLFAALIVFSGATLLMVPFLTAYPVDAVRKPAAKRERVSAAGRWR